MMTDGNFTKDQGVDDVLGAYRQRFNDAGPALLSLLYDADLLPEQIVSMRGAISFAACVEAFELGKREKAE